MNYPTNRFPTLGHTLCYTNPKHGNYSFQHSYTTRNHVQLVNLHSRNRRNKCRNKKDFSKGQRNPQSSEITIHNFRTTGKIILHLSYQPTRNTMSLTIPNISKTTSTIVEN